MDVAVVLTCYNEGAYIGAAVRSVLDQTAQARIGQIVVVDDGSRADTLAALEAVAALDGRVQVIRGPGGWTCCGARNRGVAATSAPVLAFLDGDDTWMADKLARQLAALDGPAPADFVYTGYEAVPPGAAEGSPVRVYDLGRYRRPLRRYVRDDTTILPSALLLTRAAFTRAGGWNPAFPVFGDKDLALRLLRFARPRGLPEPLIRKFYRTGSLSQPKPELMGEHAQAVFQAAVASPEIAPYLRRHLAQRAAKLGLVAYYAADLAAAGGYARLARAMDRLEPRTVLLSVLAAGGAGLHRRLSPRLERRRRLHARPPAEAA